MENNFDKRLNQLYWLMVLKVSFLCCFIILKTQVLDSYKISNTYGADYHFVVGINLELLFSIQDKIGEVSGRAL
jgi:cytochrome b561